MTQDQIFSILRAILTFGGGLAVSAGYLDNATLATIVGGLMALGGVIWSIIFHAGVNKGDAVAVITGTASASQQKAVATGTAVPLNAVATMNATN
jgi:hypothetical protein